MLREVGIVLTADQLFKQGLDLLRDDDRLGALSCFEKANGMQKTPEIQSYLARCIAQERGQIREALNLCQESIDQEADNPVHYLNLGCVYLIEKRTEEALNSFRKGLSAGENHEIRHLLEKIGVRRKPVFPFLSRSNLLNRIAGLILARPK
jgi:tetratricopeptide (TPR) repeat protein